MPRGDRSDYALERRPIGAGGAGTVFKATHKPTKSVVAFKKLNNPMLEDPRARMRREIAVCSALADHPGVVDLLDHDPNGTWYVMQLADGDLGELRDGLSTSDVIDLIAQVAGGLGAAHAHGYIHRDLKPANILRFDKRWVVADWGLVRRPRGETTTDRTKIGAFYGTESFAAPEAWDDAHSMGASSDVYSLGQILGWIPEGLWPTPNIQPKRPGCWSIPVAAATRMNPSERSSLREFVKSVVQVGAPLSRADLIDQMVARAKAGDSKGIDPEEALHLASLAPSAPMLFDVLPRLDPNALQSAAARTPNEAIEVLHHYRSRRLDWGNRSFQALSDGVSTVVRFAAAASSAKSPALLEAATAAVLDLDERWDSSIAREVTRSWLARVSGASALLVAAFLRRCPEDQKRELARGLSSTADPAIRHALWERR